MRIAILAAFACTSQALKMAAPTPVDEDLEKLPPLSEQMDFEETSGIYYYEPWVDNTIGVPRSSALKWVNAHEEHKNFISGLEHKNPTIMWYGDSLVEHWEPHKHCTQEWPHEDMHHLWKTHFTDVYGPSYAFGFCGDTTSNLLFRLQNGESPATIKPKLVMLMIGTNDIAYSFGDLSKMTPDAAADAIFAGYQKIVEELDRANTTILLSGLLPRGWEWGTSDQGNPMKIKKIITSLNKKIASLASDASKRAKYASGIHYADCGHAILDPATGNPDRRLMADGVHPNVEGNKWWAACLQTYIDKILPRLKK